MEYLFVLSTEGGWWLKIDTVDQLLDYHQKTDANRYENALRRFFKGERPEDLAKKAHASEKPEDLITLYSDRDFQYMQAASMLAQSVEGTILDGFSLLRMEAGAGELRALREYGSLYINPVGGHTSELEYTQFCRRKELLFPDFTEKDIHIRKFPGGVHWYAYIGDIQLRHNEKEKWNTYEAAKEFAYSVLKMC